LVDFHSERSGSNPRIRWRRNVIVHSSSLPSSAFLWMTELLIIRGGVLMPRPVR
jgi:hypothetical protein